MWYGRWMHMRALTLGLLVVLACGCRGKKPSGPVGELTVTIAEATGTDGKRVVRVTTKARRQLLVAVKLLRPPTEPTDSCFTKEAESCTVEFPIDAFHRYAAERAAPLKPFEFMVTAKPEGAPEVEKKVIWSRPAACTTDYDCEGLDFGVTLRCQQGLVLALRPWTEPLTVTVAGKTVTGRPGAETLVPLDGAQVTFPMLRQAISDVKSGQGFEVPIKITCAGGTVFDGVSRASVGGLMSQLSGCVDKPLPWAGNTKKMLVLLPAPGGRLVDTPGDPKTLLDVGLIGVQRALPSVQVPCGTYRKVGPGVAASKDMTGSLEVVQLSVRQARTGKLLKERTLKAVGNPCSASVTTKGSLAGFIDVSKTAVSGFFAESIR